MKEELNEKQKAILQEDEEMLEDIRNSSFEGDFVHNMKPSTTPNPFGFERKNTSKTKNYATARNIAPLANRDIAKTV